MLMDASADWVQEVISQQAQTHATSAVALMSGPIGKDWFED